MSRLHVLLLLLYVGGSVAWPVTDVAEPEHQNSSDVAITNTTQKSPIKQLVKDMFKLYDAVSSFVSPWFAPAESTTPIATIKADNETTEPTFDDFEDPGTTVDEENSEARRLDLEAETFLRYVRSADPQNVTLLIEFASQLGASMLHETRKRRDVTKPSDLFEFLVTTFFHQARALWEEHGTKLTRHVRDVWNRDGTSLVTQTRDVLQGRNRVGTLISSLSRHVRYIADQVAGRERVDKVMRHIRQVQEGRQSIFQGYYDFIINEYSYKFWAVYMLSAAALLTYSAIAAIYYAKFNTAAIDYELYDDFARSNVDATPTASNPLGLIGSLVSVNTFKRIMEAITSNKYS